MKLLVTTSHSLLRVDIESGAAEPLHRGLGLYFGIADDGERLYVAARGRMVSSEVPAEQERGRILVFDRRMHVVEELAAPFPMRDLHEILWDDGVLWTTCSYDNRIAVYDSRTQAWDSWQPLGVSAEPPHDANHFNSFAIVQGLLCVIAHNFGASELLRFDRATRALVSREPFGQQAHNIRETEHGLVTCSSAEGALISLDGRWRVDTGGFPRGLLITPAAAYVGISEIAERKDRDLSEGRILVYDRAWKKQREIALPGEGLVLEIRAAR